MLHLSAGVLAGLERGDGLIGGDGVGAGDGGWCSGAGEFRITTICRACRLAVFVQKLVPCSNNLVRIFQQPGHVLPGVDHAADVGNEFFIHALAMLLVSYVKTTIEIGLVDMVVQLIKLVVNNYIIANYRGKSLTGIACAPHMENLVTEIFVHIRIFCDVDCDKPVANGKGVSIRHNGTLTVIQPKLTSVQNMLYSVLG